MNQNKFYITTTLPYVNSRPHIGFALELVQADVIARYHKEVLGQDVFFNTGTDEHGLKIYQKALEAGQEPKKYCDEYAEKFKQLLPALGISSAIHFIRTTDPHHISAAQEFWKRCAGNGDIYKATYKIKYCVGCELEKTESDLDESGHCLIHPHLEIEIREEENYFFKFSKYEKPLLEFYEKNKDFVVPNFRFNEIKEFVKSGLQDFSVSRLKTKMPWGVPVPGDEAHIMYVWFDALINYISTLGWGSSKQTAVSRQQFADFWPGLQIAGKDNLRQQSAMWQAMLMSAGLPNSKQIIIHGFINSGGQKMSKSLGNVADPYAILNQLQQKGLSQEQAIDALRYYLLREISTFEDGDYSWEKLVESYNAGLANGVGNLTSRILKMAVNAGIMNFEFGIMEEWEKENKNYLDNYEIQKAMDAIWRHVQAADKFIQFKEPFKVVKADPKLGELYIKELLKNLFSIAALLKPFLPYTGEKILAYFNKHSGPSAEALPVRRSLDGGGAKADKALKQPKEENIPRLFPRIEL